MPFTQILSFSQKPNENTPVRGIITSLDVTIFEASVTLFPCGSTVSATIDPSDCTESLYYVIQEGGPTFRVECSIDAKQCVQLFLMVDCERVDALLSVGSVPAEEHVINLTRNVWQDAIVLPTQNDPSNDILPGISSSSSADVWNEDYPLFSHQSTTVRWMKGLEERMPHKVSYPGNIKVTSLWYIDTENECFTQNQSTREACLTGGICADGTGSGKTATLLNLVVSTAGQTSSNRDTYTSGATLVIVPINLVSQWQGEMRKFIRRDGLNIVSLVQGKELKGVEMRHLCSADIVLTTFHFLRSCKLYTDMVESTLRGRGRTRPVLSSWRRLINNKEPILEAVSWKRIVIDELHDTFDSPRDLRQLKLFDTTMIWGLTATPILDTQQAQHLYMLLSREKAHHPNLLAAIIEFGVRAHSVLDTNIPDPTLSLKLVNLSAEERMRFLAEGEEEKGTADIIKKYTFVSEADTSATAFRIESLSVKLEGIERSVRVLESAAHSIDEEHNNVVQMCLNGDSDARMRALYTRDACESQNRDLAAARQLMDATRAKLDSVQTQDRIIQQRLAKLQVNVCNLCNMNSCDVAVRCCSAMCCRQCIDRVMKSTHPHCSLCSRELTTDDIANVPVLKGVGTKMSKISELIASLYTQESVILFVQWKSMMRGTKTLLNNLNIKVLLMEGNLAQRSATLTEFMSSGVLLLCLEDCFAGLHLAHAHHIIFAHSIVGDRRQVERLEKQAIARCVRHGQTEQVKIYSFIVTESEEEKLWFNTH